jgi:predicted MPP superfamily phosphohydrolase
MYKQTVNFLHLSDLHLTTELLKSGRIDAFFNKCKDIDDKNKIDCTIITGDIFHQCKNEITEETKVIHFFDRLKSITPKIVMCQGNHEMFFSIKKDKVNYNLIVDDIKKRAIDDIIFPASDRNDRIKKILKEFDHEQILKLENTLFHPVMDEYGLASKFIIDGKIFNTIGIYETPIHPNLIIVNLNSAWLNFDTTSSWGNMVVGNEIVEKLNSDIIKLRQAKENLYVITIIHNDFNWFALEERHKIEGNFMSTIERISDFSELILCGHEHGEVPPSLLDMNSYLFKVGSPFFTNEKYPTINSFSNFILNFSTNTLIRNYYELDKTKNEWSQRSGYSVNYELYPKKTKTLLRTPIRTVEQLFTISKSNGNDLFKIDNDLCSENFTSFREFTKCKQQKLRDLQLENKFKSV